MDTLEKYCADSYFVQSSAKESALCKSLNKQKHLLTLYNEKLRLLVNVMRGSTAGEHAREVMEMLDMY